MSRSPFFSLKVLFSLLSLQLLWGVNIFQGQQVTNIRRQLLYFLLSALFLFYSYYWCVVRRDMNTWRGNNYPFVLLLLLVSSIINWINLPLDNNSFQLIDSCSIDYCYYSASSVAIHSIDPLSNSQFTQRIHTKHSRRFLKRFKNSFLLKWSVFLKSLKFSWTNWKEVLLMGSVNVTRVGVGWEDFRAKNRLIILREMSPQ